MHGDAGSASDGELIAAYREGDSRAFEAFYGRHRRGLYVYLVSLVRCRETAEELMQETFAAFLGRLDRLDGTANLGPYLFAAARHRAIDHLRRERRGRRALQERVRDPFFRPREPDEPPPAADPERLNRLLHELPEEQREVIVLRALAGMTFAEIAVTAGAPEATVVSRYRYGMEKLRASLAAGKVPVNR